jgi:hypothetical protein
VRRFTSESALPVVLAAGITAQQWFPPNLVVRAQALEWCLTGPADFRCAEAIDGGLVVLHKAEPLMPWRARLSTCSAGFVFNPPGCCGKIAAAAHPMEAQVDQSDSHL